MVNVVERKIWPWRRESHLADTMTASPSLHRSAGMDLRHCLDRRKRPGKNTEPAARMVSMVTWPSG